jgi:hypothetical protein
MRVLVVGMSAAVLALALLTGCNDPASSDGTVATSTACNDGSSGCAPHTVPGPNHHDVVELASKAESGLYMNGTLAALGSFEWDVAPITNRAADVLLAIPLALKKGEISKAEGQSKIDAADRAHNLAKKALSACKQDAHTGKCKGDEAKARALLDQARAALSGL